MKRYIRKALPAAVAAALCLSAASCTFQDKILKRKDQHIEISRPAVISFSWWGSEIRSDYTIQGIREYESRVPEVDIRGMTSDLTGYKENLDALIAGNKEPDIIMLNSSWLPEYSPDGNGFCDLNQFSDVIDLSNFSVTELSYGTVDGKLNALPVSLNAMSFYYNRRMLNSYGLTAPQTWDDLFKCAEVLSKDEKYVLISSSRHYWKMLIAREEQITGKASFGSEGFGEDNVISMMLFYKQLLDKKVIPFKEYDRSDFLNGKALGEMLWVSDAQYYAAPLEDKGSEVMVGEYLRMKTNRRFGWYVKPTSLYAISRNSEHPREAAKFLNFLMNDSTMTELQGTEKGVPLSRSALEVLEAKSMLTGIPYQASKMVEDNSDRLELMPTQLEDPDRVNAFFEYFDLFYYGKISVYEAAESFVKKYPFTAQEVK